MVKPKAFLFPLGKSEEVEWESWTLSFEILEGASRPHVLASPKPRAGRPASPTAPPMRARCRPRTEKGQSSAEESAAYNEELSREVAEQLSYISLEIVK